MALDIATNPATGEKVALIDGAWVPAATNDKGEIAYLVGGAWKVDAVSPPPTSEPRSMPAELLRQVGLTARAGVQGITAIPNMFGDAVGLNSSKTVSDLLTRIGLPNPENSTERVVQDVAGAMTGGGGTMALGRGMMSAASPVAQGIGATLASQPLMQTAGAATGAAAGGSVRESGGGVGSQVAASVLGAVAPAVLRTAVPAATKGLFRGGEAGRQTVADNIKLFEDSGVMPTVGQASESRFSRGLESTLAKTPGGAGRIVARAESGATNLGQTVDDIAEGLSSGSSSTKAGSAIEKGIANFVEGFRNRQTVLYNKLDQYIPSDRQVQATNTQAKLAELNAPITGAEQTSSLLKTPRMGAIGDAVVSDAAAKPPANILSSTLLGADGKPLVIGQTPGSPGGMPYQSLKELRTAVGAKISTPSLTDDIPTAQWKQLYGALSQDMEAAAKAAGPEAEKAFTHANNFTKAGHARIDDYLSRVAGKNTLEKVFEAAVNPSEIREGASTINGVMRSLDLASRQTVQSAFIKRLGTATAGQQGAAGDTFSTSTFLTNWNKISPEAKMTLFAGKNGEVRSSLDKIAQVAENIKEGSKVFANPSGTGQAASASMAGGGALMALLLGRPGAAAAIGGVTVAANGASRLMTNPDFVRWLATATTKPTAAIPSALNVLTQKSEKMNSEDRAEVEKFITAARGFLKPLPQP